MNPGNVFYPLLLNLLSRATDLSTCSTPLVTQLIAAAPAPAALGLSTDAPLISTAVETLTSSIDTSRVDDVFSLLKNDDVLTLLSKSRDRLSTLVNTDLPEQKARLLEATGISIEDSSQGIMGVVNDDNRKRALEALDNLLNDEARRSVEELSEVVGSEEAEKVRARVSKLLLRLALTPSSLLTYRRRRL